MKHTTHCINGHAYEPNNFKLCKDKDGSYYRACKICKKAQYQKWKDSHRETWRAKKRRYHYRSRYGITIEQRDALLLRTRTQGCDICKRKQPRGYGKANGNGWHIDHKEGTKIVRGILCANCNMVLGLLHEDRAFIDEIIRYLGL
jgi:hypothetical protein